MVYQPLSEIEPFITMIYVFAQALVMCYFDLTNEYRLNAIQTNKHEYRLTSIQTNKQTQYRLNAIAFIERKDYKTRKIDKVVKNKENVHNQTYISYKTT